MAVSCANPSVQPLSKSARIFVHLLVGIWGGIIIDSELRESNGGRMRNSGTDLLAGSEDFGAEKSTSLAEGSFSDIVAEARPRRPRLGRLVLSLVVEAMSPTWGSC